MSSASIPFIKISPHGGLNRRFPEHKIATGDIQKLIRLDNLMSLDGRIGIVEGATRLDSTPKTGTCSWTKRMYYEEGIDNKKYLFSVIGDKIYRLDEETKTLMPMTINLSATQSLKTDVFPISTTVKASSALCTYLVDTDSFYKFLPNSAGEWERVVDRFDIDGNKIEPIFNAEWLDRQWVLVKGRNVLIGSANLQPETFDDATDSVIIELPPGQGGYPRALIKYRGLLFVFHDDYFVPVTGSSASTFGVRPGDVVEGYGTNAPRSVLIVKNKIVFLNSKDNELYRTAGSFDSTEEVPLSYDIKLRDLINPYRSQDTVCHFDSVQNLLRVAYFPSGGSYLGDEEIYSIAEQKWCGSTRGRRISCYAQWNGYGDNGRLTTGRSDIGTIMWNDSSLNFDGDAIHYKLITGSYTSKDPFDCQFEEFYIECKPQGNTNINISYFIDSRITTVGNEQVDQQGEGFSLGLIQIADQNIFVNRFIPMVDRAKGRMIRFEIEGQSPNQLFELYSIYVFYNLQETKFSKYISGL